MSSYRNLKGGDSAKLRLLPAAGLPLRVWLAVFCLTGTALSASAADTVEPWSLGLSDFELYVSRGAGEAGSNQLLLGYGVTRRFSLGLTWGREYVVEEETDDFGAVLIWTVWDRVVEVDGLGEYVAHHPSGADHFHLGLEASYPHDRLVPYSRLGLAWPREGGASADYSALFGISLPLTGRWEALAETEWGIPPQGRAEPGLALGLNVRLLEHLELITEARRDWPAGGPPADRVTVGVIATLEQWGEKTQLSALFH